MKWLILEADLPSADVISLANTVRLGRDYKRCAARGGAGITPEMAKEADRRARIAMKALRETHGIKKV